MEDDLIICRCEEVTLEEIARAVQDGARTVSGIRRRTRAGMGACQGRICQPLVRKLLAQESGEETGPATVRPPARPVLLAAVLAAPPQEEKAPDGEPLPPRP